jgi:hypothetical protein
MLLDKRHHAQRGRVPKPGDPGAALDQPAGHLLLTVGSCSPQCNVVQIAGQNAPLLCFAAPQVPSPASVP